MGVYIKGREMPNNCQECVCINDEYFYCQAVGRQPQDENVVSRRPNWCPLVDVVHCKDCKYCEHTLKRPNVWKPNETSDEHYNCLRIENGIQPIVFPDSFCSFGKRGDMRVTL